MVRIPDIFDTTGTRMRNEKENLRVGDGERSAKRNIRSRQRGHGDDSLSKKRDLSLTNTQTTINQSKVDER